VPEEEPEPRTRGELQHLVIAALASYHARGDVYQGDPAPRTSAEITEMVNIERSGPPISRKVVLTVLRRLQAQDRVARSEARDGYRYALRRNRARLRSELRRLEVEYGPVARAEFERRAEKRPE